jgi:hypothetical protein
MGKEVEVGVSKTPVGDSVVPKNLKPIRSRATEEGECAKEGCAGRKKGHCPNTRRTRSGGHKHKKPPRQPPHRKQGHPSGQLYTQGGRARRPRCTSSFQST